MTGRSRKSHRLGAKGAITPRKSEHPLYQMQREMNRVLDRFLQGAKLWPPGSEEGDAFQYYPRVDVVESDANIEIRAELPGLDPKDLRVSIYKKALILRGEKKEKRERQEKAFFQTERQWGSFYRAIPLPCEVDSKRADATFKKGVISIRLPKSMKSQPETKEIPIRE